MPFETKMIFIAVSISLILIHSLNCKNLDTQIQLGSICQNDSDCGRLISNSFCFKHRCICRHGFEAQGVFFCQRKGYHRRHRRQIDFDIQMLGEECDSHDQCRRTPVDGTKACYLDECQCSPGFVPIDTYRCIRDFEKHTETKTRLARQFEDEEMPGYGSLCTTTRDCRNPTVDLQCIRGSCACLEGSVPLGKYLCYSFEGNNDDDDDDDDDNGADKTTTEIPTVSTSNPKGSKIIKDLGHLGHHCTTDYYCRQAVAQSHCHNGKCACIDGFFSSDSVTCVEKTNYESFAFVSNDHLSLLGGSCITNANCQTVDSICLNLICTCPEGYFAIDDWTCVRDEEYTDDESMRKIVTKGLTTTLATDVANPVYRTTKRKFTNTATITTTTNRPETTTSVFIWWPWSSSTTMPPSVTDPVNTFRYRCILNRQCASIDENSHCTLFGRCVCNMGYRLEVKDDGMQRCVRELSNDDDCD